MQQQSHNINFCHTCIKPHDYDHPNHAPPPTITDTFLPAPTPSTDHGDEQNLPHLRHLRGHLRLPVTSFSFTSSIPTAPSTSDGDSVLTCPHCDSTFTSHISLVGYLRIHRTETGELVPGAPTHSRDRHPQ
ncbi:unnamed protein product [Schistocephalus solidus]|uniref:C2H2-type domain-containing protein n=1 Tax=Schistocephalus solidus TaxID=70667 RepID=A0A183TAM4_SCHSO|nr:unnamed protein product [Schistocephalus solidus]